MANQKQNNDPPPDYIAEQPGPSSYMNPGPQIHQPQAHFANTANPQGAGTTVIVNQPAPRNSSRMWSTGLCACYEDVCICLTGMCCPGVLLAKTASDMGESCCLGCIVMNASVLLRTKWRTQEHINGSILDDCMVMTCFWQCALCQLAREVQAKGRGNI